MKVIVTGATGFVGSEVLRQCIDRSDITSIVVLTRKELSPELTKNDKVKVLIHKDFEHYPDSVVRGFQGAQACLWCLGGPGMKFPDIATARKVNIDYTLACAEVIARQVVPYLAEPTFKFVLCSGAWAERDPSKWNSLWFLKDTRRYKVCDRLPDPHQRVLVLLIRYQGEVEKGLLTKMRTYMLNFQAYIVEPAAIIPVQPGWLMWALSFVAPSVRVDELAAVMIDLAFNGELMSNILDWSVLGKRGRELLRRTKKE